jgi:hypothetical protein
VSAELLELAMLVEATPGALARARAFVDAGSPVVDPGRISYRGNAGVRAILVATIARLPPPMQWLAVMGITWREVGRSAMAWTSRSRLPRSAPGCGVGDDVEINGCVYNDALPGVIAHELAHVVHRAIEHDYADGPEIEHEETDLLAAAVRIRSSVGDSMLDDREQWVSTNVRSELRADEQARRWGFMHSGPDEDDLRRHYGAMYDEAARLAALASDEEE